MISGTTGAPVMRAAATAASGQGKLVAQCAGLPVVQGDDPLHVGMHGAAAQRGHVVAGGEAGGDRLVGSHPLVALVELHDGWITLESEPDKGASFKIHLPGQSAIQSSAAVQVVEDKSAAAVDGDAVRGVA